MYFFRVTRKAFWNDCRRGDCIVSGLRWLKRGREEQMNWCFFSHHTCYECSFLSSRHLGYLALFTIHNSLLRYILFFVLFSGGKNLILSLEHYLAHSLPLTSVLTTWWKVKNKKYDQDHTVIAPRPHLLSLCVVFSIMQTHVLWLELWLEIAELELTCPR